MAFHFVKIFHWPNFQIASPTFLSFLPSDENYLPEVCFLKKRVLQFLEKLGRTFTSQRHKERMQALPMRRICFLNPRFYNTYKLLTSSRGSLGIDKNDVWVLNCFQGCISVLVKTLQFIIYKTKTVLNSTKNWVAFFG